MSVSPATPEFPRRFVSPQADFGLWEAAEPLYRELSDLPVSGTAEIERWLLDWSELDAVFEEEHTRRYTSMTCQTDDPQRQQRYLQFVEQVKPRREPWTHRLRQRLVALMDRHELPRKRYEVLERSARNAILLYRDENVPLKTEDEKCATEFQQITGAMSVVYEGSEQTLQQLARYQEEPERRVREETWRLSAQRYLDDAERLDTLYERMVALRHRTARNADCADFREYKFKQLERFDYTPQQCLEFHRSIEEVVLPAARRLNAERCRKLGVAQLRPWDLLVDPMSRSPLRPFDSIAELNDKAAQVFSSVHPDFGRVFETLRSQNMLDLDSRKGKAPGGYQSTFQERRMPFIFMNAVGTDDDVRTLLHEGGHAFHTWACRNEPLLSYRDAPTEFSEVASMGMECLALPHTHIFYGKDDPRARRQFFEDILRFFPFMACVDAFQHHVYTHTDEGVEAWKEHWSALTRRFNSGADWSGLEGFGRVSWHRKLHIFEVPFYYVEYGIAQLGALQVWLNSRRDATRAVALYRQGLTLGGSRPLPELFEAAGCRFDFSTETLRPLINAVMEEIEQLTSAGG